MKRCPHKHPNTGTDCVLRAGHQDGCQWLPPEFGSLHHDRKIEHLSPTQRMILVSIPRGEPAAPGSRHTRQLVTVRTIFESMPSTYFGRVQEFKPGCRADHIIRDEIKFMVDHGVPIVSCGRGYFRPTRAADPYLMASRLYRQGAALIQRAKLLAGARAFDQIRKQRRMNLNRE